MEIKWLGHSCFQIKSERGIVIITDPYGKNIGYELPPLEADIVLMSHLHFDHNAHWRIGGEPKVIKRTSNFYEEFQITVRDEFINFRGYPTYHDKSEGRVRGPNTVFSWELDGIHFVFMGDLCHKLSIDLIEKLVPVDILFIPVGGLTTLDAKEAAEVVKALAPRWVFPMHYRTKYFGKMLEQVLSEPVDEFLLKMREVKQLDTNLVRFSPHEFKLTPRGSGEVYVLSIVN